MNLNLPVEANDFVRSLIAQGKYPSEEAADKGTCKQGMQPIDSEMFDLPQLDLAQKRVEPKAISATSGRVIRRGTHWPAIRRGAMA